MAEQAGVVLPPMSVVRSATPTPSPTGITVSRWRRLEEPSTSTPPSPRPTGRATRAASQPWYPASAWTIWSWSAYAGETIRSGGTNSSGIPFIMTAKANGLPLAAVQ
jgi:hypothetical protein